MKGTKPTIPINAPQMMALGKPSTASATVAQAATPE